MFRTIIGSACLLFVSPVLALQGQGKRGFGGVTVVRKADEAAEEAYDEARKLYDGGKGPGSKHQVKKTAKNLKRSRNTLKTHLQKERKELERQAATRNKQVLEQQENLVADPVARSFWRGFTYVFRVPETEEQYDFKYEDVLAFATDHHIAEGFPAPVWTGNWWPFKKDFFVWTSTAQKYAEDTLLPWLKKLSPENFKEFQNRFGSEAALRD